MVKSQTIRSINKLVASRSSLINGFAAIAGSIREKTIKDITRPSPLNGHVMKYVFELRRTFLTTGVKMFYQHTVTLKYLMPLNTIYGGPKKVTNNC